MYDYQVEICKVCAFYIKLNELNAVTTNISLLKLRKTVPDTFHVYY